MLPGEPLIRYIQNQAISVVILAPSVWEHLPEASLPSLTTAITGGEACAAHIVERWAPGRRFYNAYGPTESTVASSVAACLPGMGKPTIGKPLANTYYYVVDGHMHLCPIGVPGELLIGGMGVARGYLNRPALTHERFIPNPFSQEPGARAYRTGDLVRWLPDGSIDYLGRLDKQVKIRGFRIELGEIESVLATHQDVQATTVICHTDNAGEKQLVAYVVPTAMAAAPSPEELQAFLAAKLPRYMVPHVYMFLEQMPLTPAGKVDERALLSPATAPHQTRYVAPRNPVEHVLTEIFSAILRKEQIGIYDNFFALGGHSLLATQVVAHINTTLQLNLPIMKLFEAPTVADLANWLAHDPQVQAQVETIAQAWVELTQLSDAEIEQRLTATAVALSVPPVNPVLVTFRGEGAQRPFFCVHPIDGHAAAYANLAHALDTDQPVYGLQSAHLLQGAELHALSIEVLAAQYIAALRSVQTEGPYRLGGWSFGGLVAFEMAQQLHQAGQPVDLLVLLDTQAPGLQWQWSEVTEAEILTNFAWDVSQRLQVASLEELQQLQPEEQLAHIVAKAQAAGTLTPDLELPQLHKALAIFKQHMRAALQYVPRTYPEALTFFRAKERFADDTVDWVTMWSDLAGGGMEVFVVPGNHYTLLRQPHVQMVADKLTLCIRKRSKS